MSYNTTGDSIITHTITNVETSKDRRNIERDVWNEQLMDSWQNIQKMDEYVNTTGDSIDIHIWTQVYWNNMKREKPLKK